MIQDMIQCSGGVHWHPEHLENHIGQGFPIIGGISPRVDFKISGGVGNPEMQTQSVGIFDLLADLAHVISINVSPHNIQYCLEWIFRVRLCWQRGTTF